MKKPKKDKSFLKLPKLPGGNEAFRKFIAENLQYPSEAVEKGIEGVVLVEYEVDDNGSIHNPVIMNRLGYGCDEEALRLVGLLKYEKVKNRGMRVKSKVKTKIAFKLPGVTLSYNYSVAPKKEPAEKPKEQPKQGNYEYTISF